MLSRLATREFVDVGKGSVMVRRSSPIDPGRYCSHSSCRPTLCVGEKTVGSVFSQDWIKGS
jgi:hypothetical protein